MANKIDCAVCELAIDTEDCLVATVKHVPAGCKGCSITFTWVPTAIAHPDNTVLGSTACAKDYFEAWAEAHMKAKPKAEGVQSVN